MDNAERFLEHPNLLEISNYSFGKNTSIASLTYVAGAGAVSYQLEEINCSASVDTSTLTETIIYALDPINVSVTVDDATIVATDPHALTATDISVSTTVDTAACFENDPLHPIVENWTVQVLDQGGSNVFYLGPTHLDGDYKPVLSEANLPWMLQRGTTYVFDVSNASNSGHPFRFRDASDASYTSGVTTSGTEGNSGATVTFAVPLDAPSTLKYYCTVHGNAMGNFIYPAYRDVTVANVTVDSSTLAVADPHQLTSTDISVSVTVDAPTVGIVDVLTSTDINVSVSIDTSTATENDVLVSTDISCTSSVDNSSISQVHNSTLEEVNVGVAVDSSIITQVHDISLTEIDVSVSVDSPIYVENVALLSTDISCASLVDNSTMSVIYNIVPLDIFCNTVVDKNRILGFAEIIDVESNNIQEALIIESLGIQDAIVIDQITEAM